MTLTRRTAAAECVFCQAQGVEASARLENTALLKSDRFTLMPAVGPLVPGHVLLVSRGHTLSLAAMGPHSVAEYESVVDKVAKRYSISRGDLLEAEHGARNDSLGGGCIGHTHVNLIPGLGCLVRLLEGTLDCLPRVSQLGDLMAIDVPYVLMRAGKEIHVYASGSAQSQLIRRKICEYLGRDDWDWGIFPNMESVARTVGLWHRP